MRKPQTFADGGWINAWMELVILYVLTTVAGVTVLELGGLVAAVAAPFIMIITLGVVMLGVQMLWMLVVGAERLGEACGLRKSPLA